jgi:hypothetical protein
MTINLNDPKFLSNGITKEELLKKYSDYDIFKYYLGDFELGDTYHSPLRHDDSIPSFNIFYSKRHGCLLFKDFAGRRGDCIRFVQYLLGLKSYNEAIQRINSDMNTSTPIRNIDYVKTYSSEKSSSYIEVVTRPWKNIDFEYWASYGISFPTLTKYHVAPIIGYYINDFYIETKGLTFAYIEYKDDKYTYKIYRPYASKVNKWRTNHPFGVHQGYRQLPDKGNLLIITKSLKDVMSIDENLKIASIGIQAESTFIKQTVIDEYKNRFNKVITLFDNDRQGIMQAENYTKMYDIPSIFIPIEYGSKDFSDLVKNYGKGFAIEILNKLLK